MDFDNPSASIENILQPNTPGTIRGAVDVFDINQTGDPALNPGSTNVGNQFVDIGVEGEDPDRFNSISTIANPDIFDSYAGVNDPQIGDPGFTGYKPSFDTPEQESTVQNIFGKVGQTVEGALTELGKIPGAIVDATNKTVDVFGKKLNVGKTLASLAINKIVGGPISLVFDVLKDVMPEQAIQTSIVDELKTEKDYGFNMQSGNLNQDPFGRNPVSGFGDYEQTLKEDILGINQSGFQTEKMTEKKKEFAQDYFNKKAEKAGGVEVEDGTVLGPGEAPGEVVSLEDQLQEIQNEKIAAGIQTADDDSGSEMLDTTPTSTFVAEEEDEIQTYEPPAPPSPPTGTDRPGGDDRDDSPAPSSPSPNKAAGQAAEDAQRAAIRDAAKTGMTVNQAKESVGMPANLGDTGGGDNQSNAGKIVCTMMNESYGFGSFRNKIWMKFHKDLSPEYQKGYHKLFLPLVRIAKTNKIVKKILEHIAVHSTIDMRQATRGKTHLLGRVYRKILLPLCYWVGKNA
jgi:hypothetical protein